MFKRLVSKVLFYKYYFRIDSNTGNVKRSDQYISKVAKLTGLYDDLRSLSAHIDGNFIRATKYTEMKQKVIKVEIKKCFNEFIIESKPNFRLDDPRYYNREECKNMTEEEFLDLLVWLTRRGLLERINEEEEKELNDLDNESLANQCYVSSKLVEGLCNSFNVRCRVIKIPAGFTDEIQLFGGSGYHYFAMVSLLSGEYILDCTYRQFFRLDKNLINRMGVYGMSGCDPGFYMTLDSKRYDVADKLLKRGWVKATPDNFKCYMDGFALAFRNCLYYEKNNEVDIKTSYSFLDYKSFLKGDDNQINREGFEFLGVQEDILKDKDYCFKLK